MKLSNTGMIYMYRVIADTRISKDRKFNALLFDMVKLSLIQAIFTKVFFALHHAVQETGVKVSVQKKKTIVFRISEQEVFRNFL
jgi:hypothetical protein